MATQKVYNYATGGYVTITKSSGTKSTKKDDTKKKSSSHSSSNVKATSRAQSILEQIDKREASKISGIAESSNIKADAKSNASYYVDEKGQGYSIAPSKITTPQYVEKKTGLGVSVAPSIAESSDIYVRKELYTPARTQQVNTIQTQQQAQSTAFRSSGATISAASPGLAKSTQYAKVKDVGGSFWQGFTLGKPPSDVTKTQSYAYQLGLLGALTPTLPFGKIKAGAGAASKKVVSASTKAYEFTKNTRLGGWLKNIGIGVIEVEAINLGAKKTGYYTAPESQKQVMQAPYFDLVTTQAYQNEREFIKSQPWYKQVAYEIAPLNIFKSISGKAYETTLRQNFQEYGLQGPELNTAVAAGIHNRQFRTIGESANLLNIARQSERIGSKGVKKAFSESTELLTKRELPLKTFSKVGLQTAKAGVYEGALSEYAQERARQQKVSAQNIAIMGAIGGGSAGIIGGLIPAVSVKSPGKGKVIQTLAYITDPYEWPGDVLAGAQGKISAKITGKAVRTPAITEAIIPGSKDKGYNLNVISQPISTPVNTNINQNIGKARVKTPSYDVGPKRGVFSFTNVNINPITNTNVNSEVPSYITQNIFNPTTNTNAFTNINQPGINTNIDTTVTSSTFTNIFSTVPVITPQLRIPPPVPLLFNTGANYNVASGRRSRKYINELKAAQSILYGKVVNNPRKYTKRRKRRK